MINFSTDEIDDSAQSALIEEIRQAFADVPYPAGDDIFGTPEHRAACEECRDLNKLFAGKNWPDLIGENKIDFEVTGMALFNLAGWRYYLPAYLMTSIQDEDYRTIFFSPGDHLEERLRYLNVEQVKALTAYIFVALKFESIGRISYRSYQKQLSYWKAKYKEVVGEELETEY